MSIPGSRDAVVMNPARAIPLPYAVSGETQAIIKGYLAVLRSLIFEIVGQTVLIFFIVALIMVLGALAFVVMPLMRSRAAVEPISDAGSNVAIYK